MSYYTEFEKRKGELTRKEFDHASRYIKEQNKKYGDLLRDVPESDWPKSTFNVVRVLRSRRYLVQVIEEANDIIRLSICRTAIDRAGHWLDGINWEEMQSIKNEVGFADRDAVEIFPAADSVVNVANMRHLWILPEKLAFAWRVE